MPVRKVEPRQPRFVGSWDIGRYCKTGLCSYCVDLDTPIAHQWQSSTWRRKCPIELARHQILHLRVATTIRHELPVRSHDGLEKNSADVLWTTRAGRAFGYLVGLGLQPCDEAT